MVANGQSIEIEGTVAASNDRGLRLDGDEEWINRSKWAAPVVIPEPGTRVRLACDPTRRFFKSVEVIGMPIPLRPQVETGLTTDQGFGTTADPLYPDRDRKILRQAVLNSAINIMRIDGVPTDPDAVIDLAVRLELWVLRPLADA